MPKTIEYCTNGVREIPVKKECHSCWDCKYLVNMVDPSQYMCRSRTLNNRYNKRFPYDNTRCKEFKARDEK